MWPILRESYRLPHHDQSLALHAIPAFTCSALASTGRNCPVATWRKAENHIFPCRSIGFGWFRPDVARRSFCYRLGHPAAPEGQSHCADVCTGFGFECFAVGVGAGDTEFFRPMAGSAASGPAMGPSFGYGAGLGAGQPGVLAVFPDCPRTSIAALALSGVAPMWIGSMVFLGKLILYAGLLGLMKYLPSRLGRWRSAEAAWQKCLQRRASRFVAYSRRIRQLARHSDQRPSQSQGVY